MRFEMFGKENSSVSIPFIDSLTISSTELQRLKYLYNLCYLFILDKSSVEIYLI